MLTPEGSAVQGWGEAVVTGPGRLHVPALQGDQDYVTWVYTDRSTEPWIGQAPPGQPGLHHPRGRRPRSGAAPAPVCAGRPAPVPVPVAPPAGAPPGPPPGHPGEAAPDPGRHTGSTARPAGPGAPGQPRSAGPRRGASSARPASSAHPAARAVGATGGGLAGGTRPGQPARFHRPARPGARGMPGGPTGHRAADGVAAHLAADGAAPTARSSSPQRPAAVSAWDSAPACRPGRHRPRWRCTRPADGALSAGGALSPRVGLQAMPGVGGRLPTTTPGYCLQAAAGCRGRRVRRARPAIACRLAVAGAAAPATTAAAAAT
jgi:hypothetical protein